MSLSWLEFKPLPVAWQAGLHAEKGATDGKEANRTDLELLAGRHVTVHIRQPGNAFAIGLEPMAPQWLIAAGTDAGKARARPGIVACSVERQSSSGSKVCRLKATITASCSRPRTVECGSAGPIGRSATEVRLRHF